MLSFKGTATALAGWQSLGGGSISVIRETVPVSIALPNALQLSLSAGEANGVGFANTGYSGTNYRFSSHTKFSWSNNNSLGIKVTANTQYKASFYYRFQTGSEFSGTLDVGLQDDSGTILAMQGVNITGSQTTWKQVQVSLNANITAKSTANMFTITVNGNSAVGESINFAMLSLFPPTFKDRENGMRVDIAEVCCNNG
jgi:alpha-L-arabinofuranosidase